MVANLDANSLNAAIEGREPVAVWGLSMLSSQNAVVLCWVLIPLLGLVVWGFFYLRARWAYRLPRGWRKDVSQISLVFGAVGIFVLQVNLMNRLAPGDAHGSYFHYFIVVESGGPSFDVLHAL